MFEDFGFYKIEEVFNKVILLENDFNGIWNFLNRICERKVEGKVILFVVVNCNFFILGYRYLIEKVFRESDIVYVFVVLEDKLVFIVKVRY